MRLRKLNIALLAVTAINALFAGWLFMRDPSGHSIGMHPGLLAHSPFSSFFIPGLVLFSVNGLLAVFTCFMLAWRWNRGPLWLIAQGVLLTGWILVQMWMLRQANGLHLVFGLIGLFFFVSGIFLYRQAGRATDRTERQQAGT